MNKGKTYRLHRQHVVGGDLPNVFGFFKSPHNLEAITPPWLGFRILESSDREVREGTWISYRLRLHGISVRWESRISEYIENTMFADEQIVGPYQFWYHRHMFRAVPGGVEIEDVVEYRMPLGVLGRLAHWAFVRRQLQQIFAYRAQAIGKQFPLLPAHAGQAAER